MKTTNKKKGLTRDEALREALGKFDLKALERWMKRYNLPLYKSFIGMDEDARMASMCKLIANRTDMLATEANRKAARWMAEHRMGAKVF